MSPLHVQEDIFAAGTKLVTPDGLKAIEEFNPGDIVLARSEHDVESPVEPKTVEVVFKRLGRILHLHVAGKVIRTTGEHPFFVRGRGWVEASRLQSGDILSSHDGGWIAVDKTHDIGEYETVYNMRISDHHTYFVGGEDWGFSVWAHNACVSRIQDDAGLVRQAEAAGKSVQRSIDALTAQLGNGNFNPGIGTKNLFGNIQYARARDGARVFFRQLPNGDAEILGKASKGNEGAVITLLQTLYGD